MSRALIALNRLRFCCRLPGKPDVEKHLNASMTEQAEQVYEVAGHSDQGRVRTTNEDAYGICLDAGIFVVCDGMGGAAAGEVASHVAVDVMLERLCGGSSTSDDSDLESSLHKQSLLRDAVAAANGRVFSQAEESAQLHGMGTTLVALLVEDHRAWIVHVGDSRCYRIRRGNLERLTEDHSLVDEQVRLGQLTPEEAERSPLRNVITRAVGSQRSVVPEIEELAVEPGDLFLLCSDGLTREVRDEQLATLLADVPNLDAACHALVDAAILNGGRDNVTCVLVRAR
jgi:PPM family protein phosphatase